MWRKLIFGVTALACAAATSTAADEELAVATFVGARPEVIVRQIKKLEAEMYRKARNLEFEEAAKLRDEIDKLRQLELGLPTKQLAS